MHTTFLLVKTNVKADKLIAVISYLAFLQCFVAQTTQLRIMHDKCVEAI